VAVSAGRCRSLALKADGSIVGWGYSAFGQATPPEGNDFVAVSAGGRHSLGLKADGSIVGWGYNYYGQAAPPEGNDFVAISAGEDNSLAIREVPPIEVEMKLTPRTVNCGSKGKWVKAHITLPEGFSAEDIDVDEPAVAEPMDVESEYMKVIGDGEGPVRLEVVFAREGFCASAGNGGEVEVTVVGWLTDGREFYGTDTIRIKTSTKEQRKVRQVKKEGSKGGGKALLRGFSG
jgi:hypothetical protein